MLTLEPLPDDPKELVDHLYYAMEAHYLYKQVSYYTESDMKAFANQLLDPHGLEAQQVISKDHAISIMLKVKED